MEITITKRMDGTFRVGSFMPIHHETDLPYGEDEVVAEKTFDIPEAYECEGGGPAWNGGHIMDHPAIRAWIAKN